MIVSESVAVYEYVIKKQMNNIVNSQLSRLVDSQNRKPQSIIAQNSNKVKCTPNLNRLINIIQHYL